MPVYLEVVLFEVGLFDEEELLEGALFEDGGLVDRDCDGLVEAILGYFVFDETVYVDRAKRKNRKWWAKVNEERLMDRDIERI